MSQSTALQLCLHRQSPSLYCLGLYETSSTKVYPKLFHVDYSGGSSYSERTVLHFSLAHLTFAVTETAVVFLHLFALIICSALSYGFYVLAVMFPSDDIFADGAGILGIISVSIFLIGGYSFISLVRAMGVFFLLYQLGWRYCASSLGRSFVRLPGVRLILYMHRTYWLPSGFSLRPRPLLFYLKRFIIRQSDFLRGRANKALHVQISN